MRFAISAVAAASGLLLLGLSFYGEPAVYLHQAGEQWNALMDHPAADQSAATDADQPAEPADRGAVPSADRFAAGNPQHPFVRDDSAADARAERLQQEIARLREELAARQQAPAPVPAPAEPAAAPPAKAAAPPANIASAPPVDDLTPSPAPPAMPPQAASAAPAPPAPTAEVPRPAPPTQATAAPAVAAAPMPVPPAVPAERRVAGQDAPQSRTDRPPEPVKAEPAKPEPGKAAPVRVEPPRVDPARTEPAKPDSPKPEPPRQTAAKLAMQKSIPAPPPLPQPSPPRQEADDTQSVLARLRQLAPSAPPVQQADLPPAPDVKPRPAASALLPRLGAARTALANGQIEDARRLLQQAQLQLVFGPVDGGGEDLPNAGKGATDVARALDALSANDVPLSRRYIDVAVGDLSGTPMSPPVQESVRRASGYAPAYPPR